MAVQMTGHGLSPQPVAMNYILTKGGVGPYADGNGQCMVWVQLLTAALRAQGITGGQLYKLTPAVPGETDFLVKVWNIKPPCNGMSVPPCHGILNYPYAY